MRFRLQTLLVFIAVCGAIFLLARINLGLAFTALVMFGPATLVFTLSPRWVLLGGTVSLLLIVGLWFSIPEGGFCAEGGAGPTLWRAEFHRFMFRFTTGMNQISVVSPGMPMFVTTGYSLGLDLLARWRGTQRTDC